MMGLGGLLLLGLLIVAVVVFVGPLLRRGQMLPSMGEDRALSILKERYARGEIDKAEFDARKRDVV